MSIRLNQALRELNVGVQTAVDFLMRKNLGELEPNPNTKITEEQYKALVEEFKGDKDVKNRAEQIFRVKSKDKKDNDRNRKDTNAEAILQTNRPAFKQVGKIDLEDRKSVV